MTPIVLFKTHRRFATPRCAGRNRGPGRRMWRVIVHPLFVLHWCQEVLGVLLQVVNVFEKSCLHLKALNLLAEEFMKHLQIYLLMQ